MPETMDGMTEPPSAAAASFPTWDCGSPLYDSFELASMYGVLDSHLMTLPFPRRPASRDGGSRVARRPPDDVAVVAAAGRRPTTRRAGGRRRAAARTTGIKAVLHSICRTVTCIRKL